MKNTTTGETISLLMDNELSELERRRVLKQLSEQPTEQQYWQRYHLIGDTIRQNLPTEVHTQLAQRISSALADEPTLAQTMPPIIAKPIWAQVTGFALAASVAAIAVLGLQQMTLETDDTPPTMQAYSPPPTPAATNYIKVSGTHWDAQQPAVENELNRYLLNHNEYAAPTGVSGTVPYTRIIGYDSQ